LLVNMSHQLRKDQFEFSSIEELSLSSKICSHRIG
jgi:hypothetical protein